MVSIVFDYSFDTSGFFDNANARAALEAAGEYLGGVLNDDFASVAAGNVMQVTNPSDRDAAQIEITLTDPIDDMLIFVGAQDLGGALGRAGPTGLNISGDIFRSRISDDFRGNGPVTNYEPWAGTVTFDPDADWSFDLDQAVEGFYDFISVAIHEIVHIFGFGTSSTFDNFVSNDLFTGPNAMIQSSGQGIPVESDGGHIEDGHNGGEDALDPTIGPGVRKLLTSNDLAILADIGYEIDGFTAQGSTPPIVTNGDDITVFGTLLADTIDGLDGGDQIQGNAGGDLLLGGFGNDTLFGQAGDDTLDGGNGDDHLSGGDGDDIILSSDGSDTVFAGSGVDRFEIENADGTLTLADFDLETDIIVLVDAGFASVDAAVAAVADEFSNVWRIETSGGTAVRVFHDNVPGVTLTAANFELQTAGATQSADTLVGTTGADLINALGGNDRLEGLDGNDTLNGGAGADTMIGGSGDDLFIVDDLADSVLELADGGDDSVEASVDFQLKLQSQFLENLTLTGSENLVGKGNAAANNVIGNAGNNLLAGGGANDTLIGAAGDDTLKGNKGFDSMIGGQGDDVYYVDRMKDEIVELTGEGNDQVFSSVNYTLKTYSHHVENLTLTGVKNARAGGNSSDNTLVGNVGDNVLQGYFGNDTLIGGMGDDTLKGSKGFDSMIGGQGDDVYYVDRMKDQIVELTGEGNDHVFSSVDYTLKTYSQHVENLTLTGVKNAQAGGNGRDNTLVGNVGDNILKGYFGNDTLIGGAGDDLLKDSKGNDQFTGGEGADIFVLVQNFGKDIVTDFEIAVLGEALDLSATNIANFATLTGGALSSVGSDAVITDGAGNTVTLINVNAASLTEDHFIF